jgi:type I restriction enzyme S subunit
MKNTWETERLVDVFQIKPPKNEVKYRLSDDDLVSFVPMEDLGILTKDFTATKEKHIKELSGSYTYFSDNDVLLAKITPCFENGKLGIARNLKNGVGFGSSEFIVFRSNGQIIPEYLFYLLCTNDFREQGRKRMSGAVGHKRIQKEFLENYLINFPKSIHEQKHIVSILDKAFAAIDKLKFNAEKNLENTKEIFDSYLQKIFNPNKKGWAEEQMSALFKIKHGFAFKGKYFTTDFEGNDPIVLTPGNYSEEGGLYFTEKNTKRYHSTYLPEFLFQKGDLTIVMTDLSSKMKILGKPAIIEYDNILHNQRIGKFEFLSNKIDKSFLYYFLMSNKFLEHIKSTSTGTMVKHTAPVRILSSLISYPLSIKQQKDIVQSIIKINEELDRLKNIFQIKMKNLNHLKKSILQKAFSGELTTENIDINAQVQA